MPQPRKNTSPKPRPATTVEGRENQMIALATDLAEQQLRDGTATSQIMTHYLKLGTSLAELEKAKLEAEVEAMRQKSAIAASQQKSEGFYQEVLDAFKRYSGNNVDAQIED